MVKGLPLGRLITKREDNIKTDNEEGGCENNGRISLTESCPVTDGR